VDFLLTKNQAYIIELNTVPQFYGFMEATGINVPEEIVKYLEELKNKKG
jgi:glutathione synthase/RimK-type ligase-like ATP-grasp enzyme